MLEKLFNVNDAGAKIEEMATEAESLNAKLAEHETNATEQAATLKAAEAQNQAANEQLETALARITELEAEATTVEAEAATQAADVVARLGVDEPASALPSDEKTVEELWAEYKTLGQHEKSAFYQKNRNRLFNNK